MTEADKEAKECLQKIANGDLKGINVSIDYEKKEMDRFEKAKLLNEFCHNLLRGCAEAGFTVADVREAPERLKEIIDISVRTDERAFADAIKKL